MYGSRAVYLYLPIYQPSLQPCISTGDTGLQARPHTPVYGLGYIPLIPGLCSLGRIPLYPLCSLALHTPVYTGIQPIYRYRPIYRYLAYIRPLGLHP